MKKITSFLMMLFLCCTSVFAQVATEHVDKYITIGTAQGEMVPGQWYFLHNPRNPNSPAEAFAEVGGTVSSAGSFVTDMGLGSHVKQTAVLGEVDLYQEAVNALIDDYITIVSFSDGAFIDNLLEGVNVGTNPGNYRHEDVKAFLAIHRTVEELLITLEMEGFEALQEQYPTAEDIEKLSEEYMNAYNHINENKVSLAMTGIEPGYYTFSSVMFFYTSSSDSIFYTQEEADSINNVLVEEGYTEEDSMFVVAGSFKEIASSRVAAPKKSLYSASAMGSDGNMADWAAWGTQEPNAAFLWKVEAVEGKPTEYRMINMWNGKALISIGKDSNSRLELNDTATVCFDWRNDSEEIRYMDGNEERRETVTSFNIRSSSHPENAYNYLHCGGHSGGAGNSGWIVGWSDLISTRWYMTPVDEATVDEWTNGPEAEDSTVVPDGTIALITDASQLSSPFTCSSDGALEWLIDKDPYTYWHSDWTGGAVEGGHYLQVELSEPVTGTFSLYMKRRLTSEDHPSRVRITGSETEDFTSQTLDITVDMPNAISGAESNSEEWMISIPTRFLRIEATDCASVNYGFRGYWHAAELQIYKTSNNSSWTTVIEERIAALADYPGMQAELQGAYDKYSALPEDSITVSMMTEVNGVYTRIMSAIDSYEKLPSLIALADSVLDTKTDAELLAACEDAKKINAQSSTSEQILTAYSTLSDALAPYLKLSIPMEQWNFTEWYDAENGLYYNLDTQHGLARACLKLSGEHQSLTNVDVPESFMYNNEKYYVVALGDGWTYSGSNQMLETLVLPSSIKHIYNSALGGMEKLQNIIIGATTAPSNEWPGIEFNRLKVTIPNGSLDSYSLDPMWSSALLVQQTPVEISLALSAPGELRYQIMEHVENLKEVNKLAITSGNLNTTDWNALSTMTNLMELDIEACGNTYIPGYQFRGSRLETVKLPAGLTHIEYATFNESRRLASVTIPEGVTLIDGEAFQLCTSLKDVVLNEGLTEIGHAAFYMCDITSLTIPSTVRRINNDAFAYNYRLNELNLNEGLESIMHNAFNECDSLKEVVLPSTLAMCYIPFAYCDNLTSLTSNALIPAGTDNNCPVSGYNMANVVLKVPVWSLDEYKLAPGWSQIPQIVASDYQPENIVISKDFTLRIKESEVDANYRPNVALKWSNVMSHVNAWYSYYERGNLTVAPGAMLNANSFSMFYSPLGQYYDNPNNLDGLTEYNTNSLLVEGSMRADNVTITLMNQNSAWQFISFPFDVRMSDIVPVDPNTYWVVREYSGAERANGNMEATWTDLDANDVLKAGKGYIMHCNSEEGEPVMFQVKADRTSMTRQNIFISSDNEVMLEEHIAEFEHNSSWNLIGNPYPCYYDIRCTDFSAPVTVWDSYRQNYVAYSPLDDDYVLYPGEAFFVQRPVEQESIVFYAEGRQTDRYVREMANARKSATADRKVYNIVLKGEKTADRTRVVLNEKASMAYEMNCDASKFDAMGNDASQIFTVAGNARMAINERPMGSGIVELGVVIASKGVYTIALKQAGEKKVVLEDRKLGVCTVLSADNEYTFSAVPGEAKGRFFLNFDESATGIDGIGAGQTNKEPAYNTAGVRVEDGQKGLVIKEGKKIVNK